MGDSVSGRSNRGKGRVPHVRDAKCDQRLDARISQKLSIRSTLSISTLSIHRAISRPAGYYEQVWSWSIWRVSSVGWLYPRGPVRKVARVLHRVCKSGIDTDSALAVFTWVTQGNKIDQLILNLDSEMGPLDSKWTPNGSKTHLDHLAYNLDSKWPL